MINIIRETLLKSEITYCRWCHLDQDRLCFSSIARPRLDACLVIRICLTSFIPLNCSVKKGTTRAQQSPRCSRTISPTYRIRCCCPILMSVCLCISMSPGYWHTFPILPCWLNDWVSATLFLSFMSVTIFGSKAAHCLWTRVNLRLEQGDWVNPCLPFVLHSLRS